MPGWTPDVMQPIPGNVRPGLPWERAVAAIAAMMRDIRANIGTRTLPPDWNPEALARAAIWAWAETGTPLWGILGVMYNESRFNPRAGNDTASGIGGQIPRYAKAYSDANWQGVDADPLNVDAEWTAERLKSSPYEAVRIIARHLAKATKRYGSYEQGFRAYARGGQNRNDEEGTAAWGRHVRNWNIVIDGTRDNL